MNSTLGQTIAFLTIALLAGAATSFQPGINAIFSRLSGAPIHGTIANFLVGLCAVVIIALVMRTTTPDAAKLATGPWWMWTGGLFGVFFVTVSLVLSPKMGQSYFLAAMIAGQLIGGAIIDHYGLMGYEKTPLSWFRIFGLLLIAAGAYIVKWK